MSKLHIAANGKHPANRDEGRSKQVVTKCDALGLLGFELAVFG